MRTKPPVQVRLSLTWQSGWTGQRFDSQPQFLTHRDLLHLTTPSVQVVTYNCSLLLATITCFSDSQSSLNEFTLTTGTNIPLMFWTYPQQSTITSCQASFTVYWDSNAAPALQNGAPSMTPINSSRGF